MNKDLYNLNPKKCLFCKQNLDYKKRYNKYCNHSCFASHTNIGIVRNGSPKLNKNCLHCGAKLSDKQIKFCSRLCNSEFDWNKTKNEILNTGICSGRHVAKKILIEQDGYKCKECGISEWCGKKLSLVLDHIDGNSENWNIVNLRLLCPNCDSLTPTYKAKNRGNGRYWRRQRYKEGKSY